MSDYNYTDDYEREYTKKYEGIYTSEEIELNKKLKEECTKEHVNFESILLEFSPAGLFMAQKFRDCKQKVLHK